MILIWVPSVNFKQKKSRGFRLLGLCNSYILNIISNRYSYLQLNNLVFPTTFFILQSTSTRTFIIWIYFLFFHNRNLLGQCKFIKKYIFMHSPFSNRFLEFVQLLLIPLTFIFFSNIGRQLFCMYKERYIIPITENPSCCFSYYFICLPGIAILKKQPT